MTKVSPPGARTFAIAEGAAAGLVVVAVAARFSAAAFTALMMR